MGASGCSNNTSVDLDYRYSYKVEDTPVTFSRNSSLSSLSVNSNDDEPSAEDQALLDSCISWGMPKSKSDYLDGRSDQNKKSKSTKTSGVPISAGDSDDLESISVDAADSVPAGDGGSAPVAVSPPAVAGAPRHQHLPS